MPTPGGVPVATMSPGSRVISEERSATNSGMPKIRSSVVESCIVSPFSVRPIPIASGGPASSGVTSAGPQGAAPSKILPGIHCGVAALQITGGEVVEERVAGDEVERVGGGDVLGLAADHERDLRLVVDLGAVGGQRHRRVGADERVAELAEDDRLGGRLRARPRPRAPCSSARCR